MKRARPIILMLVIFAIGLIVGCSLSAYLGYKWADTYMKSNSFVGISEKFAALQALRAGETNKAIDTLEQQMNAHILEFAITRKAVPLAKLKPSDIRLITRVRDYRASHPYLEDPQLDPVIASILSQTNKTLWSPNK